MRFATALSSLAILLPFTVALSVPERRAKTCTVLPLKITHFGTVDVTASQMSSVSFNYTFTTAENGVYDHGSCKLYNSTAAAAASTGGKCDGGEFRYLGNGSISMWIDFLCDANVGLPQPVTFSGVVPHNCAPTNLLGGGQLCHQNADATLNLPSPTAGA